MNNRWVYAVAWLAVLAGFVYLRNRMVMGDATPRGAQPEPLVERWAVPPLIPLPSDTTTSAYAVADFSASAYRAWMRYNDAVTRQGQFLEPRRMATAQGSKAADASWRELRNVSTAMADSIGAAAAVAHERAHRLIPQPSLALAEFDKAVLRADSIVARVKQTEESYFVTVDSLVTHVRRSGPSASDEGNMLEFEESRDVAIYNRSLARMRAAYRIRSAALTELHSHTFELLRQLAALKR